MRLAIVGILSFSLSACGEGARAPEPASRPEPRTRPSVVSDVPTRGTSSAGSDPAAGGARSARSTYQFDGTFHDQDERAFRLESFRGHPTIVLMFFGTCRTACPILIERLLEVDRALSPGARDTTRYLLVSFDSEDDTPARLRTLARGKGMDPRRFTLATGRPADVRTLSVILDVQFTRLGPGRYSHSNVITLLDREGVVATRLEGLDAPTGPLVSEIERMAREP